MIKSGKIDIDSVVFEKQTRGAATRDALSELAFVFIIGMVKRQRQRLILLTRPNFTFPRYASLW